MAVVRVEDVFSAPKMLGNLTGKEITVQLSAPHTARLRNKLIFFAQGWLYGESIAVLEVGHIQVTKDNTSLRLQVTNEIHKLSDSQILQRLIHSEIIVVGKVLTSRSTEPSMPSRAAT